jgi:hypothetical protein
MNQYFYIIYQKVKYFLYTNSRVLELLTKPNDDNVAYVPYI